MRGVKSCYLNLVNWMRENSMLDQVAQTAVLVLIICLAAPQLLEADDIPDGGKWIIIVGFIGSVITLLGCILVIIWT